MTAVSLALQTALEGRESAIEQEITALKQRIADAEMRIGWLGRGHRRRTGAGWPARAPEEGTAMTAWRKASRSANNGNCVEARVSGDGAVLLRDSKNPDGPVFWLTAADWAALVEQVKSA